MKANKKVGTAPELAVARQLLEAQLPFDSGRSIAVGGVRARPDFVNESRQIAVFVDGCFWHSCPGHGVRPVTNRGYWDAKLHSNQSRDRQIDEVWISQGWLVVRIWEHEVELARDKCAAAMSSRLDRQAG